MLALVLALVARPIAVLLLLPRVPLRWGERLFIMWGGLKGAVPILLAAFVLLADVEDSPADLQHRLRRRRVLGDRAGIDDPARRAAPRRADADRRAEPVGRLDPSALACRAIRRFVVGAGSRVRRAARSATCRSARTRGSPSSCRRARRAGARLVRVPRRRRAARPRRAEDEQGAEAAVRGAPVSPSSRPRHEHSDVPRCHLDDASKPRAANVRVPAVVDRHRERRSRPERSGAAPRRSGPRRRPPAARRRRRPRRRARRRGRPVAEPGRERRDRPRGIDRPEDAVVESATRKSRRAARRRRADGQQRCARRTAVALAAGPAVPRDGRDRAVRGDDADPVVVLRDRDLLVVVDVDAARSGELRGGRGRRRPSVRATGACDDHLLLAFEAVDRSSRGARRDGPCRRSPGRRSASGKPAAKMRPRRVSGRRARRGGDAGRRRRGAPSGQARAARVGDPDRLRLRLAAWQRIEDSATTPSESEKDDRRTSACVALYRHAFAGHGEPTSCGSRRSRR